MVSTFSPNINLEEPARGDQVGTWDTPVNSNMNIIDLAVGGLTTISLNNSPVVLSAAQFQAKTITFNSTLTGSVQITFPTSYKKSYEIQNLCSGTSAFVVQLLTTAAGGQIISCPPGEVFEVLNDGTNLKFKNFGRVGSYMDFACSSLPNWIQNCTVQPYLNCDGTAFSSATFPQLTVFLGSTTLPDRRGTAGYTLNQGTGRLTTALGGVDGNTLGSIKTTQVTINTSNLPAYTPSGTLSIGLVTFPNVDNTSVANGSAGAITTGTNTGGTADLTGRLKPSQAASTFTGNAQGGVSNVLPVASVTVYGMCMIRAG